MRQYLLDSTPLAAYLHGRRTTVDLIRPSVTRREAATSILVYAEITEYLKGLPRFSHRHAQLRRLLHEVYPYFLTYSIMDRYADIRRQLRPPHGPGLIGDIDTLIAATALDRDFTVVTTDSDFAVHDENWRHSKLTSMVPYGIKPNTSHSLRALMKTSAFRSRVTTVARAIAVHGIRRV
jgi:predicted nucleic acid-binding protein